MTMVSSMQTCPTIIQSYLSRTGTSMLPPTVAVDFEAIATENGNNSSSEKMMTVSSSVDNKLMMVSSSVDNNNTTKKMITSMKWIAAIQDATQCLRHQYKDQKVKNAGDIKSKTDHAMMYLMKLELILQSFEGQWDVVPPFDPPSYESFKLVKKPRKQKKSKKKKGKRNDGRQVNKKNSTSSTSSTKLVIIEKRGNSDVFTPTKHVSANRFASLYEEDSDDDEEVETVLTASPTISSRSSNAGGDFEDMDEAGDVPMSAEFSSSPGNLMSMRRLMIRIVTAQSELFAYQANKYRKISKWALGVETCHAGLWKIHQGLHLADSEISRYLSDVGGGDLHVEHREGLIEDADIVEVAVKSLTQERDTFVNKAVAKKEELTRKLNEYYIRRNNARLRMGEDKWRGNSRRKQERTEERRRLEMELSEVGLGLDTMLTLDTRGATYLTDLLKIRLNQPHPLYPINRFNKKKPTDYTSKRVSFDEYPDPSNHDWKFTGTHVDFGNDTYLEFFEKQGMLLDFNYVTGEVELSWKHLSKRGNTTFYRSNGPTPTGLYQRLLESPRPWDVTSAHKKMQMAMPGGNKYTQAAPGCKVLF